MATAIERRRPRTGRGTIATAGHGHAEHPPTSTGLNSRKMLMWLFLASDCMFFGTLIATYYELPQPQSRDSRRRPYPNEIFDIPYTSVSAFVLLMSSLTMVLALAAIQRGNHRGSAHLDRRRRRCWARSSSAASSSSSPSSTHEG